MHRIVRSGARAQHRPVVRVPRVPAGGPRPPLRDAGGATRQRKAAHTDCLPGRSQDMIGIRWSQDLPGPSYQPASTAQTARGGAMIAER
jgi:hypothetical protein